MATAPAGWKLTQNVLDTLLRPSASSGVPALERLTLTAGGAFNFFGTATLDTGDSPVQMVFNSPAFYGLGSSSDVVRLSTSHFLWNGVSTGSGTTTRPYGSQAPAPVVAGGPGTGAGKLVIDARTIEFGYDALSQAQRQIALDRLTLGFSDVTLQASERVTANHLGTLTVGGTHAAAATCISLHRSSRARPVRRCATTRAEPSRWRRSREQARCLRTRCGNSVRRWRSRGAASTSRPPWRCRAASSRSMRTGRSSSARRRSWISPAAIRPSST
jgi:hypothetical protein